MGLLNSLHISKSALEAQRLRMDVIANNVANAGTTRTSDGGPYKHQAVRFAEQDASTPFRDVLGRARAGTGKGGVRVTAIIEDEAPARKVHEPQHPDADENGDVMMPNVDMVTEMTDVVSARRAYEASVTVLNATKSMAIRALDMLRG